MVISHNIQALNTNRIANENISLHGKSTEKVSSGYKINHVGDNPVGLAMSETMRRQIRGLNQGIENTKAAINFCQTADGALNEVTEMLQRINELAVKAENGTNLNLDRHYLQAEVEQLLTEIDRVAEVTTFNEIPIFRGVEKEVSPVPDDSSIIEGDIPFTDFSIVDVGLGMRPFSAYSSANHLNLQAIVNNPDSPAYGRPYNLIFGSGSSSYPSFKYSYKNAAGEVCNVDSPIQLSTLRAVDYQEGLDANGYKQWQRSFVYNYNDEIDIKIIQQVTAIVPKDDPTQEKKYNISYSFVNNSNVDITFDFMFHADTAYNDVDQCEGYFINDEAGNGSRLDKTCMFTDGGEWSSSFVGDTTENITDSLPDSFSIIDVNSALAFSEKVSFVQGSEPNAVSIGYYYDISEWDNKQGGNNYYKKLDTNLGKNTIDSDLGFSLFWNQNISVGSTTQISFNYGIVASENDDNLTNIPIIKNPTVIGGHIPHYDTKSLWIQTGNEKGSGLWLEIDEMNTEVLGIDKIELKTIECSDDANIRVKEALHKLAISRSKIGAQQNRLEHTVANEENIVEKVTASESRIRDTDLSSEMVRYSNLSVLLQMGQNMIAQADQRVEKILTILE